MSYRCYRQEGTMYYAKRKDEDGQAYTFLICKVCGGKISPRSLYPDINYLDMKKWRCETCKNSEWDMSVSPLIVDETDKSGVGSLVYKK